jgi:hypothetical protein
MMGSFVAWPNGVRPAPPPRVTVDGVTLKVGDVVWRSSYGMVHRCTITRDSLHHWGRFDGVTYASERVALDVALIFTEKKLKQAKREATSATKSIARLKARLKAAQP